MKEILKNKIVEVMAKLKDVLSKDKVSETEKNFLCGELAVLVELLENEETKKEE